MAENTMDELRQQYSHRIEINIIDPDSRLVVEKRFRYCTCEDVLEKIAELRYEYFGANDGDYTIYLEELSDDGRCKAINSIQLI